MQIPPLLHIRYYQLKRDLGFWIAPLAFLQFLIAAMAGNYQADYGWSIALLSSGLVYMHLSRRQDLTFLFHHFTDVKWQMALNYALSVAAVSAGLLYSTLWQPALVTLLLAAGMPWMGLSVKSLSLKFINRYIPPNQFEWLAGLRQHFFVIVPLLLLALLLSPVKLFAIVPLFMINQIVLSFYNYHEPLLMLNPEGMEHTRFLNRKIHFTLKALLLVNLPFLIINSAFQPEVATFNMFFLIGFCLLAYAAIYIKYADYTPNESMGLKIDLLLLNVSLFLPYLLPLSILILLNNRKKALLNLKTYQDAGY